MKTLLILFCIVASSCAWAQTSITYFNDEYPKPEGGAIRDVIEMEDGFIIAGRFFDVTKHNPAVIRIDTLGNTLWTTAVFDDVEFEDNTSIPNAAWDILLDADGSLYAMFLHVDGGDEEYWCYRIDPESGEILWKQLISLDGDGLPTYIFLVPYDNTTIATAYKWLSNEYLKLMDKSTGEILLAFDFKDDYTSGGYKGSNINFDEEKDIYYSSWDTICKVDGADPESVIWKTEIINPEGDSPDEKRIDGISKVHFDEEGKLFIMGSQGDYINQGFIARIDPVSGEMIWFSDSNGGDYRPAGFIDHGNYFYISWQHKFSGGGFYYYYLQKIRKSDGEEIWEQHYSMGDEFEDCYGSAAALELDYDGEYIYATGYFHADNWGPGIWGNIKVDAESGEVVYETAIDTDVEECASFSEGNAVFLKDDIAYYLGQLSTGDDSYVFDHDVYLIKTNKATGEILEKYPITGTYHFQSRTLSIQPYASGMMVLKQAGLRCELEKYNADKSLEWKRVMKSSGCLYGDKLRIGNDMSIWVAGHGKQELDESPYIDDSIDSLFLYRYDTDGNLIETGTLATGHFPADMEVRGDTAFVVTSIIGNLYLRRYVDGVFSSSVFLDTRPDEGPDVFFNLKLIHSAADGKINYYGIIEDDDEGLGAQLVEVHPNTMVKTVVDTVDHIDYIHNILSLTDSTVLLSGNYYPADGGSDGALVLYDYTNNDTIWTSLSPGGCFNRSVIEPAQENIYSFGISPYASEPVYMLNKVNMESGQEIWSQVYDMIAPGYGDYENADITYDAHNDLLILAMNTDSAYGGFEYNKIPLVKVVDTSGNEIREIRLQPNGTGNHFRSITAQSWGDGSTWVGGNSDQAPHLRDGFILEFDTVYIYPGVVIDSCNALFEYTIDVSGTAYFTNLSTGSTGAEIISYYWDFCDGSVSTEEDAIHVYVTGEVDCACLTIEDELGCTDTYCIGDVAVDETKTIIRIYPNPVSNSSFYIDGLQEISSVNIFDLAGKSISFSLTNNGEVKTVSLSDPAAGVYFLRIEAGDQQWMKKLVIVK